eukprot:4101822-Pyramimonas_sp.AAC.2
MACRPSSGLRTLPGARSREKKKRRRARWAVRSASSPPSQSSSRAPLPRSSSRPPPFHHPRSAVSLLLPPLGPSPSPPIALANVGSCRFELLCAWRALVKV